MIVEGVDPTRAGRRAIDVDRLLGLDVREPVVVPSVGVPRPAARRRVEGGRGRSPHPAVAVELAADNTVPVLLAGIIRASNKLVVWSL